MAEKKHTIGIDVVGNAAGGQAALRQTAADADKLADSLGKAAGGAKELGEETGKGGQLISDFQREITTLLAAGSLVSFANTAVEAYRAQQSAIRGVTAVAKREGIDGATVLNEANQLAADGFLTLADAAKSLQNLLARGYSLDEAIDSINRLKDAAVDNRAAHLTVSEAVKTATEGLKNENSVLVDNAGVTKNVSQMWKEYAAQIGVGVQNLTQAQKVQAEVNGIMRETEAQAGAAQAALGGLEGQIAQANKAWQDFLVTSGTSLAPARGAIADLGTDITERVLRPVLMQWQQAGANIGASLDQAFASIRVIQQAPTLLATGGGGFRDYLAQLGFIVSAWAETTDDIREAYGEQRKYTGGANEAAAATADVRDVWTQIREEIAGAKADSDALARTQAEAAAKVLGVDFEEVATGLTKMERDVIAAFSALNANPTVNGAELLASLEAALGKVGEAALTPLRQRLEAAFLSGRISAEEYAEGVDLLRGRIDELLKKLEGAGSIGGRAFQSIGTAIDGLGAGLDAAASGTDRLIAKYDIMLERSKAMAAFQAGQIDAAELGRRTSALDDQRAAMDRQGRGGVGSSGRTDWQDPDNPDPGPDWQSETRGTRPRARGETDWSAAEVDPKQARADLEAEFKEPVVVPVSLRYVGNELRDAAMAVGDSRT